MRCVDVIRELATLRRPAESAELARHLESCPDCAAWVERDGALGRIWESTRPAVPSDDAWETVWANVSESLEQVPAAAPRRRWRRASLLAFGFAQAAALAAVLLLSHRPKPAGPEIARNTPAPSAKVDIEAGEFVVIHADGPEIRTESVALQESANGLDANLEFFNTIEPLAE